MGLVSGATEGVAGEVYQVGACVPKQESVTVQGGSPLNLVSPAACKTRCPHQGPWSPTKACTQIDPFSSGRPVHSPLGLPGPKGLSLRRRVSASLCPEPPLSPRPPKGWFQAIQSTDAMRRESHTPTPPAARPLGAHLCSPHVRGPELLILLIGCL